MLHKMDFEEYINKIKKKNEKDNNNTIIEFKGPKLYEENLITKILENKTQKCDSRCITNLKNFNTKEPNLLNKTATFELWHTNNDFTIDFNKMILEIQFVFDSYKNNEDKVLIQLFEILLKRKLKKVNKRMEQFSGNILLSTDKDGLRLTFTTINNNELLNKSLEMLAEKIFQSLTNDIKEFSEILQEGKDRLKKEYNSQPYLIALDYIKDNFLEDYLRLDKQIEILNEIDSEKFMDFIKKFRNGIYFKILFSGKIEEKITRELTKKFDKILSLPKSKLISKKFSIKEKKMKKRVALKLSSGNYLIRKLYHNQKNKNNVLSKCYFIDKVNYKSEIMIKLFHSIIGNIVFRELRINKQMGYVARSKIHNYNNQIFYCLFVQGSSKLPHIIDNAAEEILTTIHKQIQKLHFSEFNLSKRKNFDAISADRLNLMKLTARNFNIIVEDKYNFYNFSNMEKYSKSIKLEDMKNFFEKNFMNQDLSLTIYMYSKNSTKKDRLMKGDKKDYEDINDEHDENDISK